MSALSKAVALGVVLSLAACGNYRSQHARQATLPGELVWQVADNRLQVTRNGEVVAEGGKWERLAPAVACVPTAREWAEDATSRYRSGAVMFWTGILGGLASAVAGATLIITDDGDGWRSWTGVGLLGVSVAGLVVGPIGAFRQARAEARGIDAVNLYNDELALGAKCP